jgi:hypothetical protein
MGKLKEILDGYKNLAKYKLGLSDEKDEEIFSARREICNACPKKTKNDRCSMCGCPLVAKTRSLVTKCPNKLW